jgi:hypothetical protein
MDPGSVRCGRNAEFFMTRIFRHPAATRELGGFGSHSRVHLDAAQLFDIVHPDDASLSRDHSISANEEGLGALDWR